MTFFLISPVNKCSEGYSFNLHGWCQKGLKVTNHVSLHLKPLNSISLIDCQSECASELGVSLTLTVIAVSGSRLSQASEQMSPWVKKV